MYIQQQKDMQQVNNDNNQSKTLQETNWSFLAQWFPPKKIWDMSYIWPSVDSTSAINISRCRDILFHIPHRLKRLPVPEHWLQLNCNVRNRRVHTPQTFIDVSSCFAVWDSNRKSASQMLAYNRTVQYQVGSRFVSFLWPLVLRQ